MFTLWPLTPLVIKWTFWVSCLCNLSISDGVSSWGVTPSSRLHRGRGPSGAYRSIRFRGRKAETQVYLVLTNWIVFDRVGTWWWCWRENRASLALQLSASAERLIHCRETQKETREVTAQKGGRCPRTLLLARLINDMWSHSHQNCGQMVKEGKTPTTNHKTDINRTLGCHEEHKKGENKLNNKMCCWKCKRLKILFKDACHQIILTGK